MSRCVEFHCPHGTVDCPLMDALEAAYDPKVQQELAAAITSQRTLKDDYGRPLDPEFTAIHTVGMPGMRGKRGGIE